MGTGDFMFDADALLATRSCPKYGQAVSSSSSSYTVSHALAHCRQLATLDGCVKALRWVAAYYTVAASAKAASLRKAGATKFHVTTHTQVKGWLLHALARVVLCCTCLFHVPLTVTAC